MSQNETAATESIGDGLLEHILDAVKTLQQTVSRQSDIIKSLVRRVADLEQNANRDTQ